MLWIVVRLLLIIAGAWIGPSLANTPSVKSSASIIVAAFLAVTVFVAASTVLLLGLASAGRAPRWQLPSWRGQPLLGQPMHTLHAIALYVTAAAASSAWVVLFGTGGSIRMPTVMAGAALGCHIALRIVPRIYPRAFAGHV
jgi:hypothetical protein